ncbi:glycoside hydrolase domain-containing protein [Pseudoclavibacter sp. JSM 162008]|uniref:glycoside hydrolase domain-containing protein n=1 Tax=Pseudoclavibacter sp. JSM 162008 TaxID=3229855 RepID=UPI003524E4FE
MSDPWVTNVQTWINTAYASVSGVPTVTVNGQTGWPTMYALTRALQHELGITGLSDTFGDGTYAALLAYGNIGATVPAGTATSAPVQKYRRLVKIVQAAMYCKGYNGGNGDIDGIWSTTTTAGITKLRGDMAVSTTNKTVSPKIFKALLNMDAYVLVDGGSTTIRTIQRELNTRYAGGRKEFYIIPTDGFYSRDVQRGMMYAIQYEMGMSDSVANGNFGPGTREGLGSNVSQGIPGVANFGVGSSGPFLIKLYQAALIFNGFTVNYGGSFTDNTAAVTREFQAFCKLDVTGRSDFRTWASLLVSTGDPDRPVTACDASKTITAARAQTLKNLNFKIIGRYLTNEPGEDTLNKNIKPGELATIFSEGMSVFPIFQEGGTVLGYFNYSRGVIAARNAHDAARAHGFKPGTTIYFAVDFDAMEHEVHSNIVPYFRAIKDTMKVYGSPYLIGIYASRNICTIVSDAGYAELSFVSGMSTGFSGNLGYPLPRNWAFDQIKEHWVGTGDGALDIDSDASSGLDSGQNSLVLPPTSSPLNSVIDFITRIEVLAHEFKASNSVPQTPAELVTRYLRSLNDSYTRSIGNVTSAMGIAWALIGGTPSGAFRDWVSQRIADGQFSLHPAFVAVNDRFPFTYGLDWTHLMATVSSYQAKGLSTDRLGPEFSDAAGWGGDGITLFRDYLKHRNNTSSPLTPEVFATQQLVSSSSSFNATDVDSDAVAWLVAEQMQAGAGVAQSLRQVFSNNPNMYTLRVRFGQRRWSTGPQARDCINDGFKVEPRDGAFAGYRTGILAQDGFALLAANSGYGYGISTAIAKRYLPSHGL